MLIGPDLRPGARPDRGPRPGAEGPSVYLYPGQLFYSSEPCTVTTILGSCVSVCLLDAGRRTGGMNHYLLPFHSSNGASTPRFGSLALKMLVERALSQGSAIGDLRAKLFGGARVFGGATADGVHLGARNVEIAREFLSEAGIRILAEDVGGSRGRKLVFRTDSGEAWIRRL